MLLSKDPTKYRPNRQKGKCASCGATVPAGDGFYNGETYCKDAFLSKGHGFFCLNRDGIIATLAAEQAKEEKQKAEADAHSAERAEARRAESEVYLASPERKAEIAREKAKAADRKRRGVVVCSRCGGAGSSSRWFATGYTCYKCGGSGETPKNS